MSTMPVTTVTSARSGVGDVRVAIVGAGFIAGVHARAVRAAGASLVGFVASTVESASKAAEKFGGSSFETLEGLFRCESVDIVHVCVPNHLHDEVVLEAIAAGANVVCEKPLAVTAQRASTLVESARRAHVIGTVPFVYRYHPMVREFRARIRRGEAGEIGVVHGSYLQDWLAAATDDDWRVDSARGGTSRTFGDLGSHWCDLLEFVLDDRIVRVSALARAVLPRRGPAPAQSHKVDTEDAVIVQFRTERGVIGNFTASQVSAGRKNRLYLEVSGTDRSFGFNQEEPEVLWSGSRTSSNFLVRGAEGLSEDAARLSFLPAGHAQGFQDCFNAFVAETYQALGHPDRSFDGLPLLADGLRAAQICDAVIRSSASDGLWQEVAV
jgi:predicted dehydrogenase